VLDDWRYVALVLDRLQLYLFLAIIIAGTVGILIHAPHIFDFIDQEKIVDLIKESQDGYPVFDN
jgi:nicotinic acetylcholine receptor